jgi:hypothetical protein
VVSNLFNLLQSSSNILGGNFTTFSQDIQGDVVGDILINPDAIMAGGVTNATSNTDLTVNEKGSGLIANDVTLDAQSGNASVTGNNTAGDATTGNADAVANIVNAINSYIGAGQGFLGMVNIHGNLDGDILLPPDVLEKLIASNGMEIELSKNTNLSADITSNQAIENDITTTASTGAANVSDNTSAGSASTGDASTKLTVLNLTGREVIGENALLVFVNVLGKWVGLIVNAPGATAGAYANGSANISDNTNVDINAEQNSKIVNNVDVNAASGDANVSGNTSAGSAKTGDATASANISNISNSNFNLTKWFGVLFINVFGSWNGSFGVDTAAGTLKQSLANMMGGGNQQQAVKDVKAFKFVPGGVGSNNKLSLASVNLEDGENGPTALFASAEGVSAKPVATTNNDLAAQAKKAGISALGFQIAGGALAVVLFGAERLLTVRGRRQMA